MTLRGVDWLAVLGGSAIGATILAATVAFGSDGPVLVLFRIALITLAAAAAFVLDEPAAGAVAAVPISRRRRTLVRGTAAAVPFAVWSVGVVVLGQREAGTPVGALLMEGVGIVAVALGTAAVLGRFGHDEPGDLVASVLGAALLAVLVLDPPPHSAPLLPMSGGWGASTVLWSVLAVIAAGLVVAGSSEPYRPPVDEQGSGG